MKTSIFILFFLSTYAVIAQMPKPSPITMTSEYLSENEDVSDLMFFEGVAFYNMKFTGADLKGSTFKLTAKEIWNGKLKKETVVTNSATIDVPGLEKLKDTVFDFKVISKVTSDNKLKMSFKFPRFGRTMEFDAIKSDDYSLRNIAETFKEDIIKGEKFYLMAYILPYEKDGAKYWCAVENSGKDIENWGKKFGIKHYLVFEMCFDCKEPVAGRQ
ncbi:hypothetical protein [Rasiella sp. SM2506]|uniref:hypothetical protein n=1 Tax=Rasiella sp. SM2506 TaxID=3423914 RepID=UPI003D7AD90B